MVRNNLAAVDTVGRNGPAIDARLGTGASIARLLHLVPEPLHFSRYESAPLLLIVPCVGHGTRHMPKSRNLSLGRQSDDVSSKDTAEDCPSKVQIRRSGPSRSARIEVEGLGFGVFPRFL